MRRLASLLLFVACTTAAPPPAAPPPAEPAAPPAPQGLTLEEEGRILQLEDRREFDASLAAQWIAHPNALHRARMALALGRIGPHTFIDSNSNGEKDPGERQAGVDLLAGFLSDRERTVREAAAFALGEIGDPAGVDPLVRFANDREDAGVAAEAVEALAKLAAHIPLTTYQAFTAEGHPEGVRARAVRYLFRFNTDPASALAATFLDSPSAVIRKEAVYALSRRAHPPARAALELIFSDPDALTRAHAAAALGRIADPQSVGALVKALQDIHPWVRTNSVVAIARIAAKDAAAIARPQMVDDLRFVLALTEDADPGTRASTIETLGYYAARSELARKRLIEISANGSRWERELAAGAIARQFGDSDPQTLERILDSATNWGKVRALEGAAQLPKSGPALRKRFAADSDPLIRSYAISTIPDSSVDAEMTIIRAALNDADAVVRTNALEKYSKSKPIDLALLRSAEERSRGEAMNDARLGAISVLSDIDHPEREAFLRSLLADRDPVVRRIAAEAIEQKLKKNRPQYTPLAVERPLAEYNAIAEWSRTPHTATIRMARGTIEVMLLPQDAPMTAWNFAQLAQRKYFDNTSFMRVVPNFVIQGGDPRNDMNGGPGYAIRDEINLQKYTRGAVGMALSGPDTGGSQFFITHSPQPHLDGGYTIFGRVFEGMGGVVDQTERGDKVETIVIDAKPPVAASELGGAQRTPLPNQMGPITTERMLTLVPEYGSRKVEYKPDPAIVDYIASSIQPGDRVEVFMGTWCDDSQREVPKFLKILDVLKEQYGKELPASYVAVDRSKARPAELLKGKSIEKIATFIYYRGDQELGRIVEKPTGLLEDDLLAIVAKPR
ncbi:MAG TPA: peptidylprolyl isomerase [Thermoanaerobaculia bacterium]|nr:peptidylprolyl isomerase [Thermoanaerobaculia bacterium]